MYIINPELRSATKVFTKNVESFNSVFRFRRRQYCSQSTHPAMASITLTKQEDLLRRFLLDCVKNLPLELRPELRFAGGWVRDKLLKLPSHDIDVALSSMTGEEFGKHMRKFASQVDNRYELDAAPLGISASLRSLNHIAENPDKSKHLATMTTRFLGFDLDFANLRKETYSDASRNPVMEFGTPKEDAFRRDATINALFYNLHTEEVEDYTQRGLTDLLRLKIVRTPLAPYQTFKDDPLRVLRLIRFASKYGFEIDSEAQATMKDKSIHQALKAKISRERVGVEVEKMVSGPHPHRALMFIHDLDLYESVFANPNDDFVPALASSSPRIYDGLQIILSNDLLNTILLPKADQALSWYLAAYAAWKDTEAAKVKSAAWEGIKATRENQQVIEKAVANRSQILSIIEMAQGTPRRSEIGMAIRRLDAHANTWRSQVLYSMLCDFYERDGRSVIIRYGNFAEYMRYHALDNVHTRTPMINGKKMAEVLQTKTGPWMKRALNLVMAWELDNPDGGREDAIEMVKQKRDDILKFR